MPFSSQSGKHHIKNIVRRLGAKTGIDIGVGCGTYADLFPEIEWEGVEIWEPYIDKYKLEDKYKIIYRRDARQWEVEKYYDVAILGDVLEHMDKADAYDLLMKTASHSDTQIVSIPLGYYPQDEFDGNRTNVMSKMIGQTKKLEPHLASRNGRELIMKLVYMSGQRNLIFHH
jgi:hypothetical protein